MRIPKNLSTMRKYKCSVCGRIFYSSTGVCTGERFISPINATGMCRGEGIDISSMDDMCDKLPETQDERFMDYYSQIERGKQPSFIGIHFDSEQYADLADLILGKIHYYFSTGEITKAAVFVEYIQKIRSRKKRKYFDKNLYKYKIN